MENVMTLARVTSSKFRARAAEQCVVESFLTNSEHSQPARAVEFMQGVRTEQPPVLQLSSVQTDFPERCM